MNLTTPTHDKRLICYYLNSVNIAEMGAKTLSFTCKSHMAIFQPEAGALISFSRKFKKKIFVKIKIQ